MSGSVEVGLRKRPAYSAKSKQGTLGQELIERELDLAQLAGMRNAGLLDSPSPKNLTEGASLDGESRTFRALGNLDSEDRGIYAPKPD